MNVIISAGHGKYIRGARGNPVPPQLDEVDEARRVCTRVAELLRAAGVGVDVYFDDVSRSQNENLHRIVDYHNGGSSLSATRDLDVSVHLNCYDGTAHGVECLYVTQSELAGDMATAIARASGLTDRGGKRRTDLYFLNNTAAPAILIECAFVDNDGDARIWRDPAKFEAICQAIAQTIGGDEAVEPAPPQPGAPLFEARGRCSWFGGPDDNGVAPDEGLAFIYSYDQRPDLFLPTQPPGTTGLARRLDPEVFYIACRWDYAVTPKDMLADVDLHALVRAGGHEFFAYPADWGPHSDTNRVADLSPGLMAALGIETDDEVEVIYPAPAVEPIPPEPPAVAVVAIKVAASGPVVVTVNGQLINVPLRG